MKKTNVILVTALIAVTLGGCAAEAGPPGPQGPAGTAGATGKTGADGSPGKDGKAATPDGSAVAASIFCGGTLEGTTNMSFTYDVAQLQNGTVFVTGSISDGLYETAATRLYAPAQNGWKVAAVSVEHDASPPVDGGWWWLQLDRATLETTIVYHDVSSPANGSAWKMPSSRCVVNTY